MRDYVSNDDLYRLVAALGMAAFQAQSLEHSLVSLFAATFIRDQGRWSQQVRQLMDERYGQTLGRLIRDANKRLSIPPDLASTLEAALQERNWVIHHFYREYGALGLSAAMTENATAKLEAIWPRLEVAARSVHDLVLARMVKSGRTKEQVEASIRAALKDFIDEQYHA